MELALIDAAKERGTPAVAWCSKTPHTTRWLAVAHAPGQAPDFFGDLKDLGWTVTPDLAPPLDGFTKTTIGKAGSEIFGMWTAEEAKSFIAEAESVLASHGYSDVPHWELGYADLC